MKVKLKKGRRDEETNKKNPQKIELFLLVSQFTQISVDFSHACSRLWFSKKKLEFWSDLMVFVILFLIIVP